VRSQQKTLSGLQLEHLYLHAPDPSDDFDLIPTIKLDENDMEDTLPGLGAWEDMSKGIELGEHIPFPLTRKVN
jgi:hypothetical protein